MIGKKDRSKHQLKIKFVFRDRQRRQNKQIILCMPSGHNEFKQRHTQKYTQYLALSHTRTHTFLQWNRLIFLFLHYAVMNQDILNLNDIQNT